MTRSCEICGHDGQVQTLHHQAFFLPSNNQANTYDVVVCPTCQFLYASPTTLPNASYYFEADHHLSPNGPALGLGAIHRQFLDFIEAHVQDLGVDTPILDIGASMGHFLNCFKEKGLLNLTGLEASQHAHRLAKERYGIYVDSSTLESFQTDKTFQLITLCGVLEHLTALRDKLARIASLLMPGGQLFIAVPDASRFDINRQGEPFLEFASEHINFFTPTSLDRLLATQGFTKIAQESAPNDFYGNHQLMGLYALDSNTTSLHPLLDDSDSITAIETYITSGRQRLELVNKALASLLQSNEPVIIWGTGQLTARLLANSDMAKLNIDAFVDNNPSMQGRHYFGRLIKAPSTLAGSQLTILIASFVHARAIEAEARQIPEFSGRIFALPAYIPVKQ